MENKYKITNNVMKKVIKKYIQINNVCLNNINKTVNIKDNFLV